jgi:hypothetical protein
MWISLCCSAHSLDYVSKTDVDTTPRAKRVVGPAETLLQLGNEKFTEANALWVVSQALRHDREVIATQPPPDPREKKKSKSSPKKVSDSLSKLVCTACTRTVIK